MYIVRKIKCLLALTIFIAGPASTFWTHAMQQAPATTSGGIKLEQVLRRATPEAIDYIGYTSDGDKYHATYVIPNQKYIAYFFLDGDAPHAHRFVPQNPKVIYEMLQFEYKKQQTPIRTEGPHLETY